MRLADVFLELFTYTRYLTSSPEVQGADFETVRADLVVLVKRLKKRAKRCKVTTEDFDTARFAVFAWMDEAILCSDWPGTRMWLRQPLQREFYGTSNAGEEFFERLGTLLGEFPDDSNALLADLTEDAEAGRSTNHQVLEVYAQCLALGFTGKYFNEGDRGALDALRQSCVKRIVRRQKGSELSVFPDAYGTKDPILQKPRFGRVFDPLSILFFLLPVLIVLGMYLAYSGLLEYNLDQWFG